MKHFIIIMSLLSLLFGCKNPQQNDSITILNQADFKAAITNKQVQLIDVRTPKEYNSGHIDKAKNVDIFNQKAFVDEANKLNKDEAIYLYCRSGKRSQKAARKLDSLGFKKIYDLEGGFLDWK